MKNLGDGLMVVFASVVDAIGSAVAMQQAVAGHNQSGRHPFHVRIGLHVGEPAREDDDYFGTPVIVAKRLCDAARGDQILASRLASSLVGSNGGFCFRPVGRLRLKGLREPTPAVEVVWLPDDRQPRPPAPAAPSDSPATVTGTETRAQPPRSPSAVPCAAASG